MGDLKELRNEFHEFRDNHFTHLETKVGKIEKKLNKVLEKVDNRYTVITLITSIIILLSNIMR